MAEFDPNVVPWSEIFKRVMASAPNLLKHGAAGIGETGLDVGFSMPGTPFQAMKDLGNIPGLGFLGEQTRDYEKQIYSLLPEAKTTGEKVSQGIGNVLGYVPLGIGSAPLERAGVKFAASKLGRLGQSKLAQAAVGNLFQEAAFLPSTLQSTESTEQAAVVTGAGLLLGTALTRIFSRELGEQVAKNLIGELPFKTGIAETDDILQKQLADEAVDSKNLEALELLNRTAPPEKWMPEIAEHTAEGDLKRLESYGEVVRTRGKSADELGQEGEEAIATHYTADGPISEHEFLQNETSKALAQIDPTLTNRSILDQVRPGPTLAERKYILINADSESFREVSRRFKTPERIIEKIIARSKDLPVTARGQALFNSVVEQAKIAAERGDVDVFQVPKRNPDFENFQTLKLQNEEISREFDKMDDALRLVIEAPQSASSSSRILELEQQIAEIDKRIADATGSPEFHVGTGIVPVQVKFGERRFDPSAKSEFVLRDKTIVHRLPQEQISPQFRKNLENKKNTLQRILKEEIERTFLTADDPQNAAGVQIPKEWADRDKTSAARFATGIDVPQREILEAVRDRRLLSIKQVLEKGDYRRADLMLQSHVGQTALRKMADSAVNDLSNITNASNVPMFKKFAQEFISLRGTNYDVPGIATHFPQLEFILGDKHITTELKGVLAAFKDAAEPDKAKAVEWIIRHEYAHALEKFLIKQVNADAKLQNISPTATESWKILKTLRDAAYLHDARSWDPIAKAVDDLRGRPWPKDIDQRFAKPPGYEVSHDSSPTERFADVVALMTTAEGRSHLNPLVRGKLEPFFGRIVESYTPAYKLDDVKKRFYEGGPGYLGVQVKQAKGYDTTKNAGKIMTTPQQESQTQLAALRAAVDDDGNIPRGVQDVIKESGPVASQGFEQMLDSGSPFNKGPMLKGIEASGLGKKKDLPGFIETLKTLRAASMLSGMATQLANILSNTAQAAIQPGITAGAVVADIAKTALGVQKGRQVFAGEVLAGVQGQLSRAFGMNAALPASLRQFANELRHSKEFINSNSVMQRLARGIPNPTLQKAGRVVATVVDLPFSALRSADNYFFEVNFAGNIYKQAYAKAAKEGLSFNESLSKVSKNLLNYDAQSKGIMEQAVDYAKRTIDPEFIGDRNTELDRLATQFKMQNAPQDIDEAKIWAERSIFVAQEGKKLDKVLDWLDEMDKELYGIVSVPLPFRRTPANIVREGLRTSPLGFLPILGQALGKNGVAELGSREASLRIGQAMFGTLAFYTLWQHVSNGSIAGDPVGYDPNKAHRDTYKALGQKPGSLHLKLFGKTYTVPLDRIQPLGGAIQTMIGLKDQLDQAKAQGIDPAPIHEQAVAFSWDLAKNLGVGDFSRNLGDLFEAIQSNEEIGAKKAAKRYFDQIGASLVPAAIRQYRAGQGSPYLYPNEDELPVVGGIKASLGYSGEPKLGLFGSTERHTVTGTTGTISGGSIGTLKNDPVVAKMAEVGAFHQSPKMAEIVKDRTKKEQVAFQVGKGRLQRQFVERVVLNSGFAGLDPEAQKRLIDKAFVQASELADKRAKAIIKLKGNINENVIFKGRT